MPQRELITIQSAADQLGRHVASVWRAIKSDPDFPKPIRIGPQAVRIDQAELDAFVELRASQREGQK